MTHSEEKAQAGEQDRTTTGQRHIPVMLNEVLETLAPREGEVYLDGTLGAGGYTRAILAAAPGCRVIALDRDPWAVAQAESYADARLRVVQGRFGDLETHLETLGVASIDAVILDIGVSSIQLDTAERGFSFRFDAPLDMRMGTQEDTPTAADIVNTFPEKEIERILRVYGEERCARRLAAEIVRVRRQEPILTTSRLAGLIRRIVPKSPKDPTDPATRSFQALRIAVNDELGELERALDSAARVLTPGGRLIVVTFHSLEDSIVKDFLRRHSGAMPQGSRHVPQMRTGHERVDPVFTLPFKKSLTPTEAEIRANPRARSARLRAGIRTQAVIVERAEPSGRDPAGRRGS